MVCGCFGSRGRKVEADTSDRELWRESDKACNVSDTEAAALVAKAELAGADPANREKLYTVCKSLKELDSEILFRWSQRSSHKQIQNRVKAVNKAIDTLMKPAIDAGETGLESQEELSWDTATPEDLLRAIQDSFMNLYDCAETQRRVFDAIVCGTECLCAMMNALPVSSRSRRLKSCFYNLSLNRIASMMAIIICRKVILEDQHTIQRYKSQWDGFCSLIGLKVEHLNTCLRPNARALFVYLDTIAEYGERKLSFRMNRSSVLEDICQDVESELNPAIPSNDHSGRVSDDKLSKACKIFPFYFENATSCNEKSQQVEQGEGHGPRKEFFHLVGLSATKTISNSKAFSTKLSQIFFSNSSNFMTLIQSNDIPPMLTYRRSSGVYWINEKLERSPISEMLFRMFGFLSGQCIYNRCTLGIPLPAVFFQIVLDGDGFVANEEDFQNFDPDAARALALVRKLTDKEFGDMLELEELDNIEKSITREQYISKAIKQVLFEDTRWQMQNVRRGFWSASEQTILKDKWNFRGDDLVDVVCGNSPNIGCQQQDDFNIFEVFRVVISDELRDAKVLYSALETVLLTLIPDQKIAFINFVTGTPRLPEPKTEILKIEMPFVPLGSEERRSHIGMLPQSHTCENTLELPDYHDAFIAHMTTDSKGSADSETILKTIKHLRSQLNLTKAPNVQSSDERDSCTRATKDFLVELIRSRILLAIENCAGYQLDDL